MILMKRDSNAEAEKVGEVIKQNGKMIFNVPDRYKQFLQTIYVDGEKYTPISPEYMDMLPLAIRGDRLWITIG